MYAAVHYYYREVPIFKEASLHTYVHQHSELELEHPHLMGRGREEFLHLRRDGRTRVDPPQSVYPRLQVTVQRIGQQGDFSWTSLMENQRVFEHRRGALPVLSLNSIRASVEWPTQAL